MSLFVTLASAWGSLTVALLIVVFLLNRQKQRDLALRSRSTMVANHLSPSRAPLPVV